MQDVNFLSNYWALNSQLFPYIYCKFCRVCLQLDVRNREKIYALSKRLTTLPSPGKELATLHLVCYPIKHAKGKKKTAITDTGVAKVRFCELY